MCTNEHPATTRSVVTDYFHWRLKETSNTTNRLFYIVRQIATECEAAYLAQELRLQFRLSSLSLTELEEIHCDIATELFSDGLVTWTRIITLIAFSAMITARLIHEGQEASLMTTSMMEWTTNFIDTNLRPWLESQHYWDGCLKIYDRPTQKRNSVDRYAKILGTIGMLTLGALFMTK